MTVVQSLPTLRGITGPHRRLRLAGALAGAGVRSALLPRGAQHRRGRAQVCGAARILTALGVRVRVITPAAPWPRTGGRLVARGSVGRVDELAVLTAVPRTVTGWTELAESALLGRVAAPPPRRPDDVLLPVSVGYRLDGRSLHPHHAPRGLADALAMPGLVVEVQLLPALPPGDRTHLTSDAPGRPTCLRRAWDSNPRWVLPHSGFQDRRHRPLGEPS
jgi:hypothetical protein